VLPAIIERESVNDDACGCGAGVGAVVAVCEGGGGEEIVTAVGHPAITAAPASKFWLSRSVSRSVSMPAMRCQASSLVIAKVAPDLNAVAS